MHTLRVFYPDYFPSVYSNCLRFPTLHVSKSCLYPGTMVEIIHALAREANLTVVPLVAEDFGYSRSQLSRQFTI
ncbi:hypothetical protein M3Y97_00998700 [Aphelenchoides bicaudatus]|nr:hypothetical protein M3Y97_00998700 [Aphelenchoides bicaudatus]